MILDVSGIIEKFIIYVTLAIIPSSSYLQTQFLAYVSMYVTHNSVSKPTPWAVAGLHGQLASKCISCLTFLSKIPFPEKKEYIAARIMSETLHVRESPFSVDKVM